MWSDLRAKYAKDTYKSIKYEFLQEEIWCKIGKIIWEKFFESSEAVLWLNGVSPKMLKF